MKQIQNFMENNKSVTAVDWLVEKLKSQGLLIGEIDNLVAVKQAKEMEKEQIIDAFLTGYLDDLPDPLPKDYYELSAATYNETFKSK